MKEKENFKCNFFRSSPLQNYSVDAIFSLKVFKTISKIPQLEANLKVTTCYFFR